ncbi:hypothetical protein M569_00940, partial [Genlisea aurea]
MMVDLTSFSDDKFDPKKWINGAVNQRHPQDPVEKHLVDLEMKLQMVSEEIAASLEEQSSAAILRIPRASRDVLRLQDDALSLRSSIAGILLFLKKAEGSSAESIATLARVDTVKRRMEAAYETLQDAAGLTQLSSTVEDVFASGDLPRAAETLANMRHCLTAVGEVAEFANIRKQLEVLEDRLDSMVQHHLIDALSNRKANVAQEMRGILTRIERFKSLESCYTKFHQKSVKKIWDEFDLRQPSKNEDGRISNNSDLQPSVPILQFSRWLPNFYDQLLLYLEQEWKWCALAFPDDYKVLVPTLLIETMSATSSAFVSRINLATGDVVPETKALGKGILDILSGDLPKGVKMEAKHLTALIELHNITGSFCRNIQHLFSDSDLHVLLNALKAIYLPYETFKQRYGQIERGVLSGGISGLDLRGVSTRIIGVQGVELSETVRRLEESIPQVILLLEAAVDRCVTFTGGSEADELLRVLDDVTLQYISTLQGNLKSLRSVFGVDALLDNTAAKKEAGLEKKEASRKMDVVSSEEEWSFVQGALQILMVANSLSSRTSVFEASLRSTLARLSTDLSLSVHGSSIDQYHQHPGDNDDDANRELSTAGKASANTASLRLVDDPEKARKLINLLDQSKDPRFRALPLVSQRVVAFAEAVNDLVYDVLILKVRQHFHDLSRQPTWSSSSSSSSSSTDEPSAHPVPSFSAYPQPYVTNVGEYLLTLPQQLEPLAEGIANSHANSEEAQFFATEWMFKVAEGATALYVEQLRAIQKVTDRGAEQLSVDIEYLSNVLSALSMPIPQVLSTFHACFSGSMDELRDLVKSRDDLDVVAANLVCKMRGVRLD